MFAANEGVTPNDKLYVDDVFSTYLYTGNGSTQTITNGIDLAGKGGLVWVKGRQYATNNGLTDTARGVSKYLFSDDTMAQYSYGAGTGITAFNSNGFTAVDEPGDVCNGPDEAYVSWTFRKAPKFFDVVTYTATGSVQTIPHNLGSVPGCIIVKSLSDTYDWGVYHRGLSNPNDQALILNSSNAAFSSTIFNKQAPTATEFYVNFTSGPYVAYLFAHDPSADGIIQCGSFTTDTNADATVNLGWEPQFILTKRSNTVDNWYMVDNMRGWVSQPSTLDPYLSPNLTAAEGSNWGSVFEPTPTGFSLLGGFGPNETVIYLVIRRSNKPPTSGTQVFAPVIGNNVTSAGIAYSTSFTVDSVWTKERAGQGAYPSSRLTGGTQYLNTSSSGSEGTSPSFSYATQTGFYTTSARNESGRVGWCFRRAPSFFDVVCYTGDGTTSRNISHSLGVFPELVIVKRRSTSGNWWVDHDSSGAEKVLYLDNTNAAFSYTAFGTHTATKIQLETVAHNDTNQNTGTYVAYLFASLPGISKVGSYTGNGSSQTINCGFTTGARFILIKRTDFEGDWYVWDSARGIIAANDPHLSLNTTAAEVTTDDSVDPDNSGFIVNQNTATNINVSGASYIFLAIA